MPVLLNYMYLVSMTLLNDGANTRPVNKSWKSKSRDMRNETPRFSLIDGKKIITGITFTDLFKKARQIITCNHQNPKKDQTGPAQNL